MACCSTTLMMMMVPMDGDTDGDDDGDGCDGDDVLRDREVWCNGYIQ